MVIGLKDGIKLAGISIIAFCAVFVCTMFLNYNIDIVSAADQITTEQVRIFYNAQVMTAKVVSGVSGGCLLFTSLVMLIFYIRHYIDTHRKQLGILKALGYSNLKTASHFYVFGLSVLLGAGLGFAGAFAIMPEFYSVQNIEKLLPEILVHFHPVLLLYLVILPAAGFSVISVIYAYFKLKMPVLSLLKEYLNVKPKKHRKDLPDNDAPFLTILKKNSLRNKKILVFFIVFASFCFSSMTQMSFSMNELASEMMGAMIMMIGIILACTTLFLAVTTVVRGNIKTIAMMRAFGYSQKECGESLLGGYRPAAYIGFAVGTVYQYALLRIMVDIVFKDMENVPAYKFDFPVMLISLVFFIVVYETILYCYSRKIKKISIKEIMME